MFIKIFVTVLNVIAWGFGVIWLLALVGVAIEGARSGTDKKLSLFTNLGRVIYNISCVIAIGTAAFLVLFGVMYAIHEAYKEMPFWIILAVVCGIYAFYYHNCTHDEDK